MTKVLITGATGFIGKFLVFHLLKQHCDIRVLVRELSQDKFPSTVQQYVGDLSDVKSLEKVGKDIDIVFHLGGYAHAWKENSESAEQHKQINFMGTQNLLESCTKAGVKKFIFFSTIKAVSEASHCINEKWDTMPDSPYGQAKRAAEDLILAAGKTHNMHVSILRLALVYGPSLKGNLYQMLKAIDKGYFLPIPPVNNRRSLVSVYDVCEAAWLAANHDLANGKIYYVTDVENYSTFQIYSQMRSALGYSKRAWYIPLFIFKVLAFLGDKVEYVLRRRLPFNSQAYNKLFNSSEYSSKKIQVELDFTPKHSLWNLLPEIVQSYRKN